MMNLIFTDLYEQEVREKFGITRNHVRDALNSPDSQSAITLEDFEIVYYIKRILHSKGKLYLLVATHKIAEDIFVDLAFRILPELISDINTIEPIIVLQELIQRFGLTIRIGYQLNKFIFREIIPIDNSNSDETQLVQIINPNNHSFLQSIFMKIENQGSVKIVNCAMAFCIDTDEYSEWVQGKLITKNTKNSRENVVVEIAPQLKGHITPIDLIQASGTFTFTTAYSEISGEKSGYFFKLSSDQYTLEVGFNKNSFYIQRNNQILDKP
jgi:hypothetical protein